MAQENSIQKIAAADLEAVMAQMAALRGDLAHLAQSVQSMANAKGLALSKDISDGMSEAASYINQKSHAADVRIEGAVAANPYIAMGMAVGMGVLIGALTRR